MVNYQVITSTQDPLEMLVYLMTLGGGRLALPIDYLYLS